jgi:HEPN domain-containing protein
VGPKGKLFQKEYAFELLEIAEGDLDSARGLASIKKGRLENICYMAQQSVEKSLKAVLCYLGQVVILSHDIDALLSHIPESQHPPHAHQLGALTEYSMIRRYEKGYEILTEHDITLAITMGESTLSWAKSLVSLSS